MGPARLALITALVTVAGSVMVPPTVSAAPVAEGPVFSGEVYTTSTACSNTAALRDAADALDQAWNTVAKADAYLAGTLPPPTNEAANPTTIDFGTITANASKHDVTRAEADSNQPGSWGVVDVANPTDPQLSTAATLQDCAPRPARHYAASAAARSPMWNATGGDGASLDAVLFEFSTPVAAFGAWFGDIENGVGSGAPARLKLFDAAGGVLSNAPIGTDRPVPLAGDPTGRTTCGGTNDADALACGNQATQFIGFAYKTEIVASMLVVVGDDDDCAELPGDCDGHAEHLSFVGPQLAVYHRGAIEVTKVVAGGSTDVSWEFTLIAENGCPLPETPFIRTVPAGGGDARFAGLPVTLDGSTPCTYAVAEGAVADWAIDAAASGELTALTVTADETNAVTVVNQFTPPTTTAPPTTVPPVTASPTTVPPTTVPPTTVPPTTVPPTTVPSTTAPTTVLSSRIRPPARLPSTGSRPAPLTWLAVGTIDAGLLLLGLATHLTSRRARSGTGHLSVSPGQQGRIRP